jgi:hypothetical protein
MPQVLRGFRIRNERSANDAAKKAQCDQHKIWWRGIFTLSKPFRHSQREEKQANCETNIAATMRSARMHAGCEQIERKDCRHFEQRKMRCSSESRTGSSEKSKDERSHEPFDH